MLSSQRPKYSELLNMDPSLAGNVAMGNNLVRCVTFTPAAVLGNLGWLGSLLWGGGRFNKVQGFSAHGMRTPATRSSRTTAGCSRPYQVPVDPKVHNAWADLPCLQNALLSGTLCGTWGGDTLLADQGTFQVLTWPTCPSIRQAPPAPKVP